MVLDLESLVVIILNSSNRRSTQVVVALEIIISISLVSVAWERRRVG